MKSFRSRSFDDFDDRDSAAVFEDMEFIRCSFTSCDLSITKKPSLRTTVRNIRIVNCEVRGCSIYPAIIEDVVVDGLRTRNLLFVRGPVFKHVVLKGKIGSIMITSDLVMSEKVQKEFDNANAAFYAGVDWALDISEVESKGLCIRNIPGMLVRRDPAIQGVVKRSKAQMIDWDKLNLAGTLWQTSIKVMLDQGYDDVILIAPKPSPDFSVLVDDLKRLRDAGIAEPD